MLVGRQPTQKMDWAQNCKTLLQVERVWLVKSWLIAWQIVCTSEWGLKGKVLRCLAGKAIILKLGKFRLKRKQRQGLGEREEAMITERKKQETTGRMGRIRRFCGKHAVAATGERAPWEGEMRNESATHSKGPTNSTQDVTLNTLNIVRNWTG